MITVIIRPMYKTDLNYKKGFNVALYENTTDGSWICRHSDPGKLIYHKKVKELHPNEEITFKHLTYKQINWKLAGY